MPTSIDLEQPQIHRNVILMFLLYFKHLIYERKTLTIIHFSSFPFISKLQQYSLYSWFFVKKFQIFLSKSQLTVKHLLHSFCIHIRPVEICLCVKKYLTFSSIVLILVKLPVNKAWLTLLTPFHRKVFV